ncbi:3-isopropylmalate dehydrogenase [Helicobacter saguini]|uniref:3-isopropylmalate dehydrogenase n=1 Tax=Helicobacter saguini TaxID=1548018 RepID=A0A347VN38_9HELI|nr:3-isopropylmalate dehydrogenase [Helicobacter saguini]MWV61914.1 3-isopropylmalate dehydrogenase [Helicobacter saguini]MWV67411.1 3-isopropylmalate dehydrogenase [Helicobacter saguini]MWV69764.1 3-isopropylmalate dehydrogenase [Helicobacter saguini]MWV73019.1 3-isopropylmalate dehydrogenase [Helicobacter saguini]TLD95603.1 3-isopropylmalate dehydrogenase [Helicobacter saguini]
MKTYNIAVLKGDGIGVEVTEQSLKVLDSISKKYDLKIQTQEFLVGGIAIDKVGNSLPDETIKGCKSADAVLFGAIGGPKWENLENDSPEKGLLRLRESLQVYANVRPAFVFDALIDASSLKSEVIKGVDLVVVRELISGIYFGKPRGIEVRNGERVGFNTMVYTESEIRRIAHYAFKLAQNRRKSVCVVDKANVLEVSRLWREVVSEVARQYADVSLSYQYVDNASMQLIRNPKGFDVILTNNLFGDILSDEASQLTGSIGLLPSASVGEKFALYEPIHGSAPDIAGQNLANPMASILSVAMMFEISFKEFEIALDIRKCIESILNEGVRSRDIASFGAKEILGCREIGDLVADRILKG